MYDGTKSQKLFHACEISGCCARNCCGNMRPFNMALTLLPSKDPNDAFLTFRRPFRCTYLCFNRPVLFVKECAPALEETTPAIGTTVNPWRCCDLAFNIMDDSENLIYKVVGSCCQPGLYCTCPWEPCNKIEFSIQPPEGEDTLGMIAKEWSGCGKEAFTDADNFSIEFPEGATPRHKSILLATVFLIDFMYFENNSNKNNRNGLQF